MRVAALQFDVRRADVAANLERVSRGLREAAAQGVQLVVLPEMWPTSFAELGDDPVELLAQSRAAVEHVRLSSAELGLIVAGSSYGPRVQGGLPANLFELFDAGARRLAYAKVHLFSPTAEHELFAPGDEPPPTVATELGRLAGLVCYDVRFPEIVRVPFRDGVDVLLVSAQWPSPRAAHWRTLLAARAIEAQCFVVACNRTGAEVVGRRRMELEFPGNSLIVDPHGAVLAEGCGRDGLVSAELDLDRARRVRVRVPVAKDERRDLYARWGFGRAAD